jgi:predicted nuclease of restriction endonuclease-like RecB superfamily
MAKTDDTIENRIYLFESLASSYVAAASELLGSEDEQVRQRATRALAELAYVSCVVADTQHLTPEQVRERVLGSFEPEQPPEPPAPRGKRR